MNKAKPEDFYSYSNEDLALHMLSLTYSLNACLVVCALRGLDAEIDISNEEREATVKEFDLASVSDDDALTFEDGDVWDSMQMPYKSVNMSVGLVLASTDG